MGAIEYRTDNVYTAARKRVAWVFDTFSRVVVSVSGGKDSAVVRHLAIEEARRRGRKVEMFFLDQEAEYESTVRIIREWMAAPDTIPRWFQVPVQMTNATSHVDYWLHAWGHGEPWIREKDPIAIHEQPGAPDRFYDFFPWYEAQSDEPTAFLIGLRSRESFNRFRSVTKNPGYQNVAWSTKTKSPQAFRFYPIYEWTFGDVWKCIADEGLTYNAHYDRMYAKHGVNERSMRVSNLVHEQAFRCLVDLQEFEPDTYERLMKRLGGVHCAALYGNERQVLDAKTLPAHFVTWTAYRDHLMATTPCERMDRFVKRFAKQPTDETTARMQCKQLLTNDWENNVPVASPKLARLRERLWPLL